MTLPPLLAYALTLAVYIKYPLILLATPIGGPALILATGFLLHEGLLELVPLFISLAVGELALDTLWYYIGYTRADSFIRSYGKYVSISSDTYATIKRAFTTHGILILFLAKIFMGFGLIIAILIAAGASRISFKTYIAVNALGEVIWLSILLGIGYSVGELYTYVADGFETAFLGGVIVGLCLIAFGFGKYLRSEFVRRLTR